MITTLKKRSEFLRVSAKGKKFITGTFIMLMDTSTQPSEHTQIGYTVTKKMGNAVARNRIKRRFREAVRHIAPLHAKAGQDYVLIARHKAINCPYADMVRDMEFAFSRITYMKNQQQPHSKKTSRNT